MEVTPASLALTEIYEQLKTITDAIYSNCSQAVVYQLMLLSTGSMLMNAKRGLDGIVPELPSKPWYVNEEGKIDFAD